MFFNLIKIDRSEPQIVTLNSTIKMVGVSQSTSLKTIFKDAGVLGKKYRDIKEKDIVINKKQPWAFVAVSKNFTNNGNNWEYLMGDVVTSFDKQPADLIKFEIPAKTYAVFKISPRFSFLWGPTIGLTKKYIFTEWLPKSKYVIDDDIIGDFEYHDERSMFRVPMIELYVSVKVKE